MSPLRGWSAPKTRNAKVSWCVDLADGGGERDLAVGLAAGFLSGRGESRMGMIANFRNRQAAVLLALAHCLPADGGGPGGRKILGLARIVDQDDLLLELLAGGEVVVFGGVISGAGRRSTPGSGS